MFKWKARVNPDAISAQGPPNPLRLQQAESEATLRKIATALRTVSPTLDDGDFGPDVLAASFCAEAAESNNVDTKDQWTKLLLRVLDDLGVMLDDENEDAARRVVNQLVESVVLKPMDRD